MAKSIKTTTSSQNFNKSKALLLLFALLLITSICYGDCLDFSAVMFEASSAPRGRTLLQNPTNKQSTMTVHEETTHHKNPTTTSSSTTTAGAAAAAASKDRNFGMAAHEVPSGPNPESNR